MSEKKVTLGQAIDPDCQRTGEFGREGPPDSHRSCLRSSQSVIEGSAKTTAMHGLAGAATADGVPHANAARGQSDMPSHAGSKTDVRTLKEQSNRTLLDKWPAWLPTSCRNSLLKGSKEESISSKDLEKYFKQAGFKLPTKVEQVLVDAKHAGYFGSSKSRRIQAKRCRIQPCSARPCVDQGNVTQMATRLAAIIAETDGARRALNAVSGTQLHSQKQRDRLKAIVEQYFNEHRAQLTQLGPHPQLHSVDENMPIALDSVPSTRKCLSVQKDSGRSETRPYHP